MPFTDLTIQQNGTDAGSPGTIVVSFVGGKTPYTISYIIDTFNVTPSRVATRPANGLHSDTLDVQWGPKSDMPFTPEGHVTVVAADALGAVATRSILVTLIPNAAKTLGLISSIGQVGSNGTSTMTVNFDAGAADVCDVTVGNPAGGTATPSHIRTAAGDTSAVFVFTPDNAAVGCDARQLVTVTKQTGEQDTLFGSINIRPV